MGERIHHVDDIDISAEARGRVQGPLTAIHGAAGILVTPTGGRRTAEAVPHAVHVEIEGMGHNMPRQLWPRIMVEIDATVERTRDVDATLHTD